MNSAKYRDALYEPRKLADLRDLVRSSAERHGRRDAFLVKDAPGGVYRPISYARFRRDVDSLGTALCDMGLQGRRIALIGENRYEWVVSYLAVANGTGVIVPFDREMGADELAGFMRRAGTTAVIYSGKLAGVAEAAAAASGTGILISMDATEHEGGRRSYARLVEKGRQMLYAGRRDFIDAPIDPEAMCALLFTSGTTGLSKGVMLSHKNIASNVYNMSKHVCLMENETGLSVLPMHHTYEMTCHVLTSLFQGGRIAICEGLRHIVKNLAESRASILVAVPLIFENMHKKVWKNAEAKGKAKKMRRAIAVSKLLGGQNIKATKRLFKDVHNAVGGNLRLMISGGAAIDPVVIEDFCAMGFTMIQGYGMTESAPIIAVNRDRYSKAASVGPPLPGAEVRIIDEDENGVGEIVCRGESVMLGYYDDPEETARVVQGGWLQTGDFGRFDEDGFLYVTGRKKNIIVTKNGKNISPEELEHYLRKIPLVGEVVVWGKNDQKSGDIVICADIFPNRDYLTEGGAAVTDAEMKLLLKGEIDRLNEKLPLYKRVKRFMIRNEEFEKTSTQKIKRHTVAHEGE
ncbi:MAG: AMP-binding protein [Clostridiales Family XIII bacterium]|nr:AMP-binding protein [Clostridiales Family XIII bacterium]